MKQTFSDEKLLEIYSKLENEVSFSSFDVSSFQRAPLHVVYGGANLFKKETPEKFGKIALKSLENYAPNAIEFAKIFNFIDERKLKEKDFASIIYERTLEKLKREPLEDFRIDFEDGYGFRTDDEEDFHCLSASEELARSFHEKTITPFCGFRIKSLQAETYKRAIRTLDLFLTNLLLKTEGKLPENFAVTLPKIKRTEEVEILVELLDEFENHNNLENGSIKIEIMIETPESVLIMPELIKAGKNRINSAHFGAYDYTSSFGIAAEYQDLQHDSCKFARQLMQINLSPLGIRLSDSVTTEMPVPIHKGDKLNAVQILENKTAIHKAWRTHFDNVTHSLINGFYQSWDLHPAQLVARYAAIYAFFLRSEASSAARLKGFLDKATQAVLTGNQFDDAASAQGLLNYFIRALNSGALKEAEILEITGLNDQELRSASFASIMKKRLN